MKIKNLIVISIIGLVAFTGCASKPEEIQTAYVSPIKYKDYTCKQIGMELTYVSSETNNLYNVLKKKADDDAMQMGVGLILLWPTLFFLEGGDGPEATQFATLKGEDKALRKTMISKSCQIANLSPSPSEIMQAKREEAKKKQAKQETEKHKLM